MSRSLVSLPPDLSEGFEPVARLAVGGMAELELVRQKGEAGFSKLVVLKRMLPERASDPEYLHMFLDEVRIASQLRHPHIVEIFETGNGEDGPWFTMEFVRGRDLRDVLMAARNQGGLPLAHALTVVTAIASALHYAHERCDADGERLEIIHRDVSPGNILCGFDGTIKLVDFGVARARQRRSQTQVGIIKGKLAYMAPEQCRGERIDARVDVWSLGVVLYELTTGRRPIEARSEMDLLTKIAEGKVPPPSTRKAYYPRALETIVMRALARNKNHRYGSMEELQTELEALARDERMPLSTRSLGVFVRGLFEVVPRPEVARKLAAKRPRASSRLETVPWDGQPTTKFDREDSLPAGRAEPVPGARPGSVPPEPESSSDLQLAVGTDPESAAAEGPSRALPGPGRSLTLAEEGTATPLADARDGWQGLSMSRSIEVSLSSTLAASPAASSTARRRSRRRRQRVAMRTKLRVAVAAAAALLAAAALILMRV